MEIENFQLERLLTKIPANISLLGRRKAGKSVCVSIITRFLIKHQTFSRIVAFLANDFCNPELVKILKHNQPKVPSVIFYEFSEKVIQKILDQQVKLREENLEDEKHILIILDDVYSGHLYHSQVVKSLFERGRHYLVSCITSCVSFTSLASSCRRSLDILILYSCLTTQDTIYLTKNFLNPKYVEICRYLLRNQKLYESLVIESSPIQRIFRLKFRKKGEIHDNCDKPKVLGQVSDLKQNSSSDEKRLSKVEGGGNGQMATNEKNIDYV